MASRPRRTKLAHVAMHAGVSLGTASDALRGSGRMSEETRARVVAAADALGYRPDAQARALATGHSQIVALVVQEQANEEAPRIYWPRLQAEFTERLLEHRLVACTAAVADLHQLDGLPFDLVVFARLSSGDELPEGFRRAYRVLDVDVEGQSRSATALRAQFDRLCHRALDELAHRGSVQPGLLLPTDTAADHPAAAAYRSWCSDRGIPAEVVSAGPDFATLLPPAVDGILSILVDPGWLVRSLAESGRDPQSLRIVAMGPDLSAAPATASLPSLSSLTIDGRSVGRQLADLAAAALRGEPARPLKLEWLLDGHPWDA